MKWTLARYFSGFEVRILLSAMSSRWAAIGSGIPRLVGWAACITLAGAILLEVETGKVYLWFHNLLLPGIPWHARGLGSNWVGHPAPGRPGSCAILLEVEIGQVRWGGSQGRSLLLTAQMQTWVVHSTTDECLPCFVALNMLMCHACADCCAVQGLLKLMNVQTGIEQISEIEFGLTFLFILFLTEDFGKKSEDV